MSDMAEPCIISVAITGSVPRRCDSLAVPVTVPELVARVSAPCANHARPVASAAQARSALRLQAAGSA
jgi:uncharacterized protein (DUF849 family)